MSSTLCLLQTDFKKFVANIRVTHMTVLLVLLVIDHIHFENRLIFLIISHGVIRNSLFFLGYFLILVCPDFCINKITGERNRFIHYLTFSMILKFYSLSKHILFLLYYPGFILTYLPSCDHFVSMKQSYNFTII
ncbi:NADH-ubiquinone oxidoreductase chain 4 [Trichuris trichiura]|uniref:NADH:ubiquinone reductase (H(+)-translocating) n=1 Tax=Trichuris trichiura TaxID=36087 RepID=A0A077ZM38_TRITR|nr:NADH-ubiquinone oxidoreductase chain 4 [Trichuris trichiura]